MARFKKSQTLASIVAGFSMLMTTGAFAVSENARPHLAAEFHLELGAGANVIATVIVDEGMQVSEVMIDADNVVFADASEVEPGVWEAFGVRLDEDSCYAATASILLGVDAPAANVSVQKSSDKSSKKSSDKASKKSSDKSSDKASKKSSEKSSDKASKKSSDKASKKCSQKASEKASTKSSPAAPSGRTMLLELHTEICEVPTESECTRPILSEIPW